MSKYSSKRRCYIDFILPLIYKLFCSKSACAYVGGGNESSSFLDFNGVEHRGEYHLCLYEDEATNMVLPGDEKNLAHPEINETIDVDYDKLESPPVMLCIFGLRKLSKKYPFSPFTNSASTDLNILFDR